MVWLTHLHTLPHLCQLPVPVFLPTTLQSTEQIVQTIQELRSKMPSAPVAAQEDPPSPTEVTSEDQKAGSVPMPKSRRFLLGVEEYSIY